MHLYGGCEPEVVARESKLVLIEQIIYLRQTYFEGDAGCASIVGCASCKKHLSQAFRMEVEKQLDLILDLLVVEGI